MCFNDSNDDREALVETTALGSSRVELTHESHEASAFKEPAFIYFDHILIMLIIVITIINNLLLLLLLSLCLQGPIYSSFSNINQNAIVKKKRLEQIIKNH